MNINNTTMTNRTRPDDWEGTGAPRGHSFGAACREALEAEFERLKTKLLHRELTEAATPQLAAPLKRAANDAAALAWETALPLLVFPVLFEEITARAVRHTSHQSRVWTGKEAVIA